MKNVRMLLPAVSLVVIVAAAFAAEPPTPCSRSEIEALLAKAPKVDTTKLRRINIVLVTDVKDHGKDEHDYPLWQKRWPLLIGGKEQADPNQQQINLFGPAIEFSGKGAPNVNVAVAWQWPTQEQFETANLVVMHCWGNWTQKKADDVRKHLVHGRGFVVVHPAVIIPSEMNINEMTDLIGLAWENWYTRFRHGPMELKIAAKDHPICLGLPETIHFVDEAYWPLRGDKSKVTILATSDEDTGTDTQQKKPEPMFWTYQRGKGRIFGCILGHYTWTFDDPYLRILLLRGMAWAAREPVYRFDPLVLDGAPVK